MLFRFIVLPLLLLASIFLIADISLANEIKSNSNLPDFKFQVPIPNVQVNNEEISSGAGIAKYLVGVYRFILGLIAVLAFLMFLAGGFLWMTGKADKARDIMRGAIIGLFLAFGSYVILFTVNPDLVRPDGFRLPAIGEMELKLTPLIKKSCNDICSDYARQNPNLTGSGVVDEKCVPGTTKVITERTKEYCLKNDTGSCKCTFITQAVGEIQCLTYGCGSNAFCDEGENKCVEKKSANEICKKDAHCKDGLSCKKNSSNELRCTADTKTIDTGVCCYLGFQSNPKDAYQQIPVATAEVMTYRQCQEKEPTGTYQSMQNWVFCPNTAKTDICGPQIRENQFGKEGASRFDFKYQNMQGCWLFRKGYSDAQKL